MKVLAEVNEQDYGLLCAPSEVEPLMKALRTIDGLIWIEVCYDPFNEQTRAFARKLSPYIVKVNEILRFNK